MWKYPLLGFSPPEWVLWEFWQIFDSNHCFVLINIIIRSSIHKSHKTFSCRSHSINWSIRIVQRTVNDKQIWKTHCCWSLPQSVNLDISNNWDKQIWKTHGSPQDSIFTWPSPLVIFLQTPTLNQHMYKSKICRILDIGSSFENCGQTDFFIWCFCKKKVSSHRINI